MSDARSKVEGWVKGFTSNVRADTTKTEGLEGFSLTSKASANKKDLSEVVGLLAESLKEGGRKRSIKHWRRLACQHLGIKKMGAKRWDALVEYAVEHGMFHVEPYGSGSSTFDTLILDMVEAVETPEVETPEVEPESRRLDDDDEGPPPMPDGPIGPTTSPCGHRAWGKESEHEAARAAGKCCASWKNQPDWRVLGLTHPVPKGTRRTAEKQEGLGWPGLCCDPETGFYIGGLANDCRHYHSGPERCVVHQRGTISRGGGKKKNG